MVVLVTGATGFLGGVHIRQLLQEHDRQDIRFLHMKGENIEKLLKEGFQSFQGNLGDPESLKGIMKDVTDVYHLAAIAINEAAPRDIMMRVNYEGTMVLANEFLREESTRKFVYASTLGVYGFNYPDFPITEEYPIHPANNYQESKFLAEQHLMQLSTKQDMNVTAIRNSLIVGPGDTLTSPRVVSGLLNGQIKYLGKGTKKFSMVDARDCSTAMQLTTKNSISKGKAYNIKSFDICQNEYFCCYADACGGYHPTKRVPSWLAKLFAWYKETTTPQGQEVLITRTRIDRYTNYRMLDDSKIRKELGYQPQHTNPQQVINDSVTWLVENNYIQIPDTKSEN